WWDTSPEEERQKISELPTVQHLAAGMDIVHAPFDAIRDVLLETLYASRSNLVLVPTQDAFGWRDRINEPATVGEQNWTYRLPWPIDRLDDVPEACERKARLRALAERYGRA